jgi:hypothetical protein
MERLDDALGKTIEGRNLTGRTLSEEIGDAPTLLVFLRHLG